MEVDLAIVDMEVDLAFVDLDMVMEVIFNQMRKDLLSKKFRIAIDCHRSQGDGK